MAKSLGLAEIVIGAEATGIQILLEWFDQSIQAWIQHWTAGEIDDAMASAAEVAHAQAAVLATMQGDQPAVAVAEATLIREGRSLGMVDASEPQHRLVELILLPIPLG